MKAYSLAVMFNIFLVLAVSAGSPRYPRSTLYCPRRMRVCHCRPHLSEPDLLAAMWISECLADSGIRHDFSAGVTSPINKAVCIRYNENYIRTPDLRKCVYRKADLIKKVNGVEQWDLEKYRTILINTFDQKFPLPQQVWIRNIYASHFLTCRPDPTDFGVSPFAYCMVKALEEFMSELTKRQMQALTQSKDNLVVLSAEEDAA